MVRIFALILSCVATLLGASSADQPVTVKLVIPGAHDSRVTHLGFAAANKVVVSVGDDGTLRMWDSTHGYLLRTIPAHAQSITAFGVSPDGLLVATGGDDWRLRIWSAADGSLVHQETLSGRIVSLSWSTDQKQLAATDGHHVEILDTASWTKRTLNAIEWAYGLRYIANSHQLVVTNASGDIRVWSSDSGSPVSDQSKLKHVTESLLTSADAIASLGGGEIESFVTQPVLQHSTTYKSSSPVTAFTIDSQNHRVLATDSNALITWGMADDSPKLRIPLTPGSYTALAYDGSDDFVAIGEFGGSVEVRKLTTGEQLWRREGGSNRIHDVQFDANGSITFLGSQGNRVDFRTIGREESYQTFSGGSLDVRAASWLPERNIIVASGGQQIIVYDTRQQKILRTISIFSIDGLPLVCKSSGLCAWEEMPQGGNVITVQNVLTEGPPRRLAIGQDRVLALEISSDGGDLVAAVNRPVLRLWSLDSGTEKAPLQLEIPPDTPPFMDVSRPWTLESRLLMPMPGMATMLHFDDSSKLLAAGNEFAIYIFDAKTFKLNQKITGYVGHPFTLAFDRQSRRIFWADQEGTLRVKDLSGTEPARPVAELGRIPQKLSLRADGELLAVAFGNGETQLWDLQSANLVATIAFPLSGGWLTATPRGLFEADEEGWREAVWQFGNQTTRYEPVDNYFLNFYYPGLLSDLLAGVVMPAVEVPNPPRATPHVEISLVSTKPATSSLTPTGMILTPEMAHLRIDVSPQGSKIEDLRLTQNGVVVRKWTGELKPPGSGVVTEEVDIAMQPAKNRITAYAFNEDGLRSNEPVWERPRTGIGYMLSRPTLYVVAIGVAKYANHNLDLRYPRADVELVERAFSQQIGDWTKMNQQLVNPNINNDVVGFARDSLHDPHNIGGIPMPHSLLVAPQKVIVTPLIDEQATRERILQTIRDTVRSAGPEDAVIIYYSGHGIATDNRYYLVPYDVNLGGNVQRWTEPQIGAAAPTLLSDIDLGQELSSLNVAFSALILDACDSGKAFDGAEFRGPVNNGSLGRLAYEKGMYMLAASEADQPAHELELLEHSVLTYALFQEGLIEQKADWNPVDGIIDLNEWLGYGAHRVPELVNVSPPRRKGSPVKANPTQRAKFVPRRATAEPSLALYVRTSNP
jgi:WD40 repeat protein/uncharacterized caspase-like protein